MRIRYVLPSMKPKADGTKKGFQIFPPIKHVLDKFRHKLPKDELKRFGKDISKKLVASDYKNNRVEDPNAELSERQVQKIKKYVKEFLDKAVVKYNGHQGRNAAQDSKQMAKQEMGHGGDKELEHGPSTTPSDSPPGPGENGNNGVLTADDNAETPSDLDRKRKREDNDAIDSAGVAPSDCRDLKRLREEGDQQDVTPPPPPPPPADFCIEGVTTEEQRALREQEEALMRENEEAQRLEDEANHTKHMEEAADEMQKGIEGTRAVQNPEVMSH